jgi:N-formylmaleamate deformylase
MANWTSGSVQGRGATLHYRRTGGSKPPLVLLHGLTANGACWTPLARVLEDQFDVVMPDARGHGHSSAPLYGYRYEDHAADVIALFQELELRSPAILGHSMGGMTAAVVTQMHRDVRGVILTDPTFMNPQLQREVRDSDVVEQHRRILSLDRPAVLAELMARHPHRSSELLELLAEARLQTRLSAFDVLTPPNPDYRQLVADIDVPIMLVIAERGVVSLDAATELKTLNPRVRIEQISGAGHGLHFDQPEQFEAVVTSFFRQDHIER